MNTLHARVVSQPAVLSRKMSKLERCGRYEDALALVVEDWASTREMPDLTGLGPADAALIKLRFGALIGFYGHNRNLSGAQAQSKDVLTDALDTFAELNQIDRIAECENFIALAYWRTGEYREADAWIAHSLERDLPDGCDVRLYSHVIKSLVLMDSGRHEENIAYCKAVEETFRQHGDALLCGAIFANLGISLKDLGRADEALNYLELGKAFHERARHKHYTGTSNNNLALLYKDLGRYHMAHFCVDKAIAIYRRIGDRAREGSSLETKAQIYVADGQHGLALTTIDRSITILRKSENVGYLTESIMSKAKIHLALDNFTDAVLDLIEAVELTRNRIGETAVRKLIEEFEAALNSHVAGGSRSNERLEHGEVELELPSGIEQHSGYKGVWIHNSHLDSIGVRQGSLALVVNEPLKRGDPGVVLHIESGEVSCGYYDSEFGIVALEGGGEPQLFDQDKVRVLGKIVGVCGSEKTSDGKMIVRTIKSTDS